MISEHKMTVRLPTDLHRRVKAKAALQGITLSTVVRSLLEQWEQGQVEIVEPEGTEQQADQED